jgi:hypothetical protein
VVRGSDPGRLFLFPKNRPERLRVQTELTTHSHNVPGLRMGGYASTPTVRLYGVERGSLTFQITPFPRKLNCTCVNTKCQHQPDTITLAAFFGAQELYVEWLGVRAH